MDYDAAMLYVKAHPDCTSLDLSEAFGVTVAKAFTFMNEMIEQGLVYKTTVRSPTNNKKIFGYRVIDGFDEIDEDAEVMPTHEVFSIVGRLVWQGKEEKAKLFLQATNEWRENFNLTRAHEEGLPYAPLIKWRDLD